MNIDLRDYQSECVQTVTSRHKEGLTRQLIVLPTGAGKTIVMAALAKQLGIRTLLLAHRSELLSQAIDKFQICYDCDVGLVQAQSNQYDKHVVVASVQSAKNPKRLDQLREQDFQLMMIDEAHHATSPSYLKVISELGFEHGDPKKLLLGVTATPMRSGGKGLGTLFEEVTFRKDIAEMIAEGYLSPIEAHKILTKCSLQNVRNQESDYMVGELAEAVNNPERNNLIAEKYLEYAPDRKGIVFGVDVQHCKDLQEAFLLSGIATKAIYADMPHHERKSALEELKINQLQVLISCGILTEGFDEPSVSCVAMCRPTQSQSLYIQCVGRGLRLYPGKENCMILDFTDEGHDLRVPMTLSKALGEPTPFENTVKRDRKLSKESIRTVYIGKEQEASFDILGLSAKLLWVNLGNGEWALHCDDGQEIILRPVEDKYVSAHYDKNSQVIKEIIEKPIDLGYAYCISESYAVKHMEVRYSKVESSWHHEPPSEKQLELWETLKLSGTPQSKFECSLGIKKEFAKKAKTQREMQSRPPTEKQTLFLKRHQAWQENMTKHEANKRISTLVQQFGSADRKKQPLQGIIRNKKVKTGSKHF